MAKEPRPVPKPGEPGYHPPGEGRPTSPPPPLKREPSVNINLRAPLPVMQQLGQQAAKARDLPPQPGDDIVLPGGVSMGEVFGRPQAVIMTANPNPLPDLATRIQARARGRDKFNEVVALVEFSTDGTDRYEREGFWREAYCHAQQAVGEDKDITQPMGEQEAARFELGLVGFGVNSSLPWSVVPGSWLAWLKPLVVRQYRYLCSARAARKIEAAERE